MLDTLASAGPALLPALAAVGGAISGSNFVQEAQRGVKLRFGKVVRHRNGKPKIIEPGFVFIIPKIETLRRVHVRAMTLNLELQTVMLQDKLVFEVGGLVHVKVIDTDDGVYNAMFATDHLSSTASDYVSGKLRDVVSEQTYETALQRETIVEKVRGEIAEQLAQWGLEILDFRLTDCSPTPQSARAILLGVEADMRATALASAAAKLHGDVNVKGLAPTVAAALIGTPVSTALDNGPGEGAAGEQEEQAA